MSGESARMGKEWAVSRQREVARGGGVSSQEAGKAEAKSGDERSNKHKEACD